MKGCRYRTIFSVCCAITSFFLGFANTLKSGINSELSEHSCVEAATFISFFGAFVILGVYDATRWIFVGPRKGKGIPTWKEGLFKAERWELISGFLGLISLSLQTFSIYYLGASLMKVILCTAEVIMSAALDVVGGLGAGPGRKPSWMTAAAIFCVLAGVGVIMYEDWESPRLNISSELKVIACFCPLVAGCLRPVQARINYAFSTTLGSKTRGALWFLGTASIFVFLATIVNMAVDTDCSGLLWETLQNKNDWWMFCSGVYTLAALLGAIAFPPIITLGSFYICLTSGQLTLALYLDSIGAFTFELKAATTPRVLGTILTIFGAVLSRLPFIIEDCRNMYKMVP